MSNIYNVVGKCGPFDIVSTPTDSCVGLMDSNKSWVISPKLGFTSFKDFDDGLIIGFRPASDGYSWVVVDYHGNPITDERFNFIEKAGEGYFRVERGSRQNIMRRDGTIVLKEWPHRVGHVQEGYFSYGYTRRKTKTTPTRYEDGVAHVSGVIVFPPIFGIIRYEDGALNAEIDESRYIIHNGALYDPQERHYPDKQSTSLGETIEKVLNWILPGLQFYYRDTDADIDVEAQYPIGHVLRSGFYVDMSTKLQKPAQKTRFIIASAHAAQLFSDDIEYYKKHLACLSPNAMQWRHAVIHYNAWFKVLDIYRLDGLTQILLLHIPESLSHRVDCSEEIIRFINSKGISGLNLIEHARQSLEDKMKEVTHPRSHDLKLVELMHQPIGYDKEGKAYPLLPDLTPGTPESRAYNHTIHRLADDLDIVWEVDGFPWQGIVGSVCDGCIYANGANDMPFGCGRLFQKSFRTNYTNGTCQYFKYSLFEPSLFESLATYRREKKAESEAKVSGRYAINLLLDFIKEKLDGEIDNLINFDFYSLKDDQKYGPLIGQGSSENFAIIKSIMEVAFGDYWPDLNVESLDNCIYQTGMLINHGRLLGGLGDGSGITAQEVCGVKDHIKELAKEIHFLDGTIGNYVVWPNKGMLSRFHDDYKMRGYIDRLFIAIYEVMSNAPKQNYDVRNLLYKNRKLMADYKGEDGFRKFMKISLLEAFLDENGKPRLFFEGVSISARDFNPFRLSPAIEEYHAFFSKAIPARTRAIIALLKEKLSYLGKGYKR